MDTFKNIPILTYHKISDAKEFGLTTISPLNFDKQLNILKDLEYNPITFRDLYQGGGQPIKPIIITFDDGYESVYNNALPILDKYGFKSVVYLITDFIGKYNTWEAVSFQQKYKHLSLPQLKDLQKKGFEIASHGKSHRYLPSLKDEEVRDEVENSKKFLEDLTGERTLSFCYPYGKSSKRILELVKKAGYSFAAQNISILNLSHLNPFALTRRSIYATV